MKLIQGNLWFIWDLFIWSAILFLITQHGYSYWWLFMSFFLTTLPPRDRPRYIIIDKGELDEETLKEFEESLNDTEKD